MPNIIPPLLSSSPPPMVGDPDDAEDDEFGDFRAAVDLSYSCDAFSLPSTPEHVTPSNSKLFGDPMDINSNKDFDNLMEIIDTSVEKDFQDKRKDCANSEKEKEKVIKHEFNDEDSVRCASDACENGVFNGTESPQKCKNESTSTFKYNGDRNSQDISFSLGSEQNFHSKSIIYKSEIQNDQNCNKNITVTSKDDTDIIHSLKPDSAFATNETKNDETLDIRQLKLTGDCSLTTFSNTELKQLSSKDNVFECEETNSVNESQNFNEAIAQKLPNEEAPKADEGNENCECDSYSENADTSANFESIKTGVNGVNLDDYKNSQKDLTIDETCSEKCITEANEDNDFGDFNDFKAASFEREENSGNCNKEDIMKNSMQSLETFSDYNKTFEEKENSVIEANRNSNNEFSQAQLQNNKENFEKVLDNTDDFGDFDDFKAAAFEITKQAQDTNGTEGNEENTQQLYKTEIVETSGQSLETFPDLSKSFVEKENLPVSQEEHLNGISNDVNSKENDLEIVDDTDDFGNFEECTFAKADEIEKNIDFGNFEAFPSTSDVKSNEIKDDDDFDDFEDFKSASVTETKASQPSEDFGNFDSFTSSTKASAMPSKQDAENIIKEMFPIIKCESDEWKDTDSLNKSDVFEHLKDITETNAISYVWVQSTSQKMLLKSLNIDTRNILYGPGWNFMVPKFAANLSSSPLEPLKPEIVTPSPTSQPKESNLNDEVPVAQFDWNSSGLVNPLDYSQTMLLDIEQLVATLDVPNNSPFPDSEWDNWLDTINSSDMDKNLTPAANVELETPNDYKSETLTPTLLHKQITSQNDAGDSTSLNSLQLDFSKDFTADKNETETNKTTDALNDLQEFNDFEKFAPNMVPLRETHICNESNVAVTENNSATDNNVDDDDEFDDFQMVVPENIKNVPFEVKTPSKSENLESVPKPSLLTPLQPVSVPLEPLKPTIVPSASASIPTKIEWPEPGLDDDDIQNIELSFVSKPVALETNSVKIPPIETKNNNVGFTLKKESHKQSPSKPENKKKSTPDDDDWTDFVSNTQPAKTQNLQLSVLDLNNLQPVKPPVPVITPQGLMQTKISNNVYIPPLLQTGGTGLRNQRPLAQPTDDYQPSIISNQFSREFFGNANPNRQSNNHFITNNCVFNTASPVTLSDMSFGDKSEKKVAANDDDDWTDFISSQPAAAPPKASVQQHAGFSFSPNIVNNPGHFNPMSGYSSEVLSRTVKNMPAKKNMVSSISSLPELDFVISKNRTFNSKK